jgi:thioesterase domain-containing protein
MKFSDLIEELNLKEIEISFSNGKLKYSGRKENLTPELIDKLKQSKGKLIKHFWPKELGNLMPINPDGNKIPLFIVHGDNSNYIISDYFGTDQPVYGFFHPGSEGERIAYRTAREMAASYLEKIQAVWPDGPYNLIGYSFGGILAFEMAVQLQKAGYKVLSLVLIDSLSPQTISPVYHNYGLLKSVRYKILRPIRRGLKRKLILLLDNIYFLTGRPLPVEKRGYYLHIRYLTLTKSYKPSKFNGDILLFATTVNTSSYKYLGWEAYANNIRLIEIDGKHLEIFNGKDKTEVLLKEIEKYLGSIN